MPSKRVLLNYEPPSDKHRAFHNADVHLRILCGAYGSGKTRTAVAEVLRLLLTDKRYIGKTALVVGLTAHHCRNQLWEQHFKPILEWRRKHQTVGAKQGVDYTLELAPQMKLTFSNGSKCLFASLEAKQNLAGYSVSIVYADEVDKDAVTPQVWDLLCARARGESDDPRIVATCNPANQSHWLYTRYFENYEKSIAQPGTWCGVLTIFDNRFLSSTDIKNAEERLSYSALESRRLLYGEWISLEGAVFTGFNRATHLYDSVNIGEKWPRWAGLDFGFNDPTACIWVAKNPADERYYIYREYYESNRTPAQNAECITKKGPHSDYPRYYVTDHYKETVETYKRLGLQIRLAKKGKGSLEAGIGILNQLFAQDRIRISRNCNNLIRELESYQYDPRNNEPKKNQSDHALDALRYVIYDLTAKSGAVVITPRQAATPVPNPTAKTQLPAYMYAPVPQAPSSRVICVL